MPNSVSSRAEVVAALKRKIEDLQKVYPGVAIHEDANEARIVIPGRYRVGHEAHFAQVTNRFLTRLFTSINPLYGGRWNMTAMDLVEKSVPRAESMLANEPAALAEFQMTVAGNLFFIHGPASAVAMAERAAANARRSGDWGMQAMTLSFLGWEQSLSGQCQNSAIKMMIGIGPPTATAGVPGPYLRP